MVKSSQIPELDKLYQDISSYRTSAKYKELLEFIKRFPHVAPYNAMLIHIQKPGSHYVLSARDWKDMYGRIVNLNAQPLVILRPFGPVAFVFDVSDTTGDRPMPDRVLHPSQAEGQVSKDQIKHLIDNMLKEGVRYSEADHGSARGGCIWSGDIPHIGFEIKRGNSKTVLVNTLLEIVVNRKQTPETIFTVLLHELGHMYCGHCSCPEATWLPQRYGQLTKEEKEFEAESVCWMICERMGIKNPSAEYLSGYIKSNDEIPNISMDAILKAVGNVERLIREDISPRKELILEIIDS